MGLQQVQRTCCSISRRRSQLRRQHFPEESQASLSVVFESSVTLNRQAALVPDFLDQRKKSGIQRVFRRTARPATALRVSEMKVYDLFLCQTYNIGVLILLAQVVEVDNHLNIGVIHFTH